MHNLYKQGDKVFVRNIAFTSPHKKTASVSVIELYVDREFESNEVCEEIHIRFNHKGVSYGNVIYADDLELICRKASNKHDP